MCKCVRVWGVWAEGYIGNKVLEKDPKRNSKKSTCSLTKGCIRCYLKNEVQGARKKGVKGEGNLGVELRRTNQRTW